MATHLLVPVTIPNPIVPPVYEVFVERATSATGPWVRVGVAPVLAGSGFFYDNTAPLDVPVWYRFVYTLLGVDIPAGAIVGPLTLAGTGTIILSDPLRPWADLEFSVCGTITEACSPTGPELVWARFGGRVQRADAGLFDRLNSETPADVYARRKDHDGSFTVLTKSLDAIDRMYDLFTAGGPLYLRAPAVYGSFDFYLQPLDVSSDYLSDRIDQRKPYRLYQVPYTRVDRVLGLQQGTACANWCAVEEAFPTFATLTATGDTYAEIAAGTTVCP